VGGLRGAISETAPIIAIIALTFAELSHVSSSDWASVFLYNGDSIVLPLLNQSFSRGEPFEWVFSTQSFLFPEYPIFWLCSVIAGSVRGALVLNSFVNVLLLYGILRAIAGFFAPLHRIRQVFFAALGVVLVLANAMTERSADLEAPGIVAPKSIATLFLLTTYYYGVILVTLTVVLLTLWLTRTFTAPASLRRTLVYVAVVVVIGTLTMYSNPLYLLQAALPLSLVFITLGMLRRLSIVQTVTLVGAQAMAVALGAGLRVVFAEFLVTDFRSYFGPSRILASLGVLRRVLVDRLSNPAEAAALLVISGIVIASVVFLVRAAVIGARRRTRKPQSPPATITLFITLFIVTSMSSLVAGQIVTGQLLTRYLIPLFVFPTLGVVLLASNEQLAARMTFGRGVVRRALMVGAVLLTFVGSVVGIATSAHSVQGLVSQSYPPARCLERWVGDRDVSGVAPFMTARPLMLYGHQRGRVLQVVDSVVVQSWMNNLALYRDRQFSFVLVTDRDQAKRTVDTLGRPVSTSTCPSFTIYDYAGTAGEKTLNDWIAGTLQKALASRNGH